MTILCVFADADAFIPTGVELSFDDNKSGCLFVFIFFEKVFEQEIEHFSDTTTKITMLTTIV